MTPPALTKTLALTLALILTTTLAACTPPTGPLPIHPMTCPTIPPDRHDAGPPPPPPDTLDHLVLAPGHWDWDVGQYIWTPPTWVARPNQHAATSGRHWQPGTWIQNGGACVWAPAHFLF